MRDIDKHFTVLDLLDPPDQWDAIERRAATEPLRPPRTRRRPVRALAFAALITVVVVGGALLLISPTDESAPIATNPPPTEVTEPTAAPTVPATANTVPPVTNDSPPASPAPTTPPETAPTTAAPAPVDPQPVTWAPLPSENGDFEDGDHLYAVIRFGSQWVAAGSKPAVGAIAIWTSENGTDWKTSAELPMSGLVDLVDGVSPDYADGRVTALVEANGRLLAFAVVWDQSGNGGPVALSSSDGRNWVPLDTRVFSIRGEVASVAEGAGEWIAVGREIESGIDPGERPAMWRSTDGLTWERMNLSNTALDTPGVVYDIVHGASGWVAVGNSPIDNGFSQATVWTSTDGESWTHALLPSVAYEVLPGFGTTEDGPCISDAYAVAAGPAGYIAAGDCVPPRAFAVMTTAWSSPDGIEWTQSTDIEEVFDEPASIVDAVVTDTGYAMVGWRLHSDRMSPAVWTSQNGLVWEMEDLDESGGLSAIAAHGDQLVVVGWGSTIGFVGTLNP